MDEPGDFVLVTIRGNHWSELRTLGRHGSRQER
jgi:hypothetical protein